MAWLCAGSPASETLSALFGKELAPACRERLDALEDARLLLALPGISDWASRGGRSKALDGPLAGWSNDLRVRVVLLLEQEFAGRCPIPAVLQNVVGRLKQAHLGGLGLKVGGLSAAERDRLFRGLVILQNDVSAVRERVKILKPVKEARAVLAYLYGGVAWVRGVPVLGSGAALDGPALGSRIGELCRGKCGYWDPRALYRVLIVPEEGIAAYVPETATLVLSRAIVDPPNLLHRVVLLHELAHASALMERLRTGRDWEKEFAAFSGWKQTDGKWSAAVGPSAGSRDDELTRLSVRSAFSILPDPVIPGKNGEDGFAIAKAYRASLEQGPGEDFADHVAVYRWLPERFCAEARGVAPRKLAWLRANSGFPGVPPLACERATSSPPPTSAK